MSEPTFTVRIAFASDPLAASPSWTTVSGVRRISISRGRNHELDRMEAGRATVVLDNQDGDFWPDNSGGAYYGNLKVMKRINIRATLDGTPYDLFTGYIESWRPGYLGQGGYGSMMTLQCADAFKIFAQMVLNDGVGYSQEASGTRVGNVLDDIGWPAGARDIDAGQVTLQSTGGLVNINALSHLQAVQETELSLLYMARDGDVQYEDRSHRTGSPHDTSQATFGPGNLPYVDFKYSLDEVFLFNDVRVTRSGGAEQVATNSTSQTAYGKRSLVRSATLHSSDVQAELLADYLAARYADSVGRLSSFKVVPSSDNSIWPQIMSREISDRITFEKVAAGIDKDYFIEHISLEFDLTNNQYSAEYGVSDADQYHYELDAKTETLRPNSDGTFDNTSGSYTNIDESTPDDGDHNDGGASTPGTGYFRVGLPSSAYVTGIINSVMVKNRIAKDLSHAMFNVRTLVYTHSTDYFGTDRSASIQEGVFTTFEDTWAVNPNTGVAWTWAEIADLQVGSTTYKNASGAKSQHSWMEVVINFTPQW